MRNFLLGLALLAAGSAPAVAGMRIERFAYIPSSGFNAVGNLAFDRAGNLYGTTIQADRSGTHGTVFKVDRGGNATNLITLPRDEQRPDSGVVVGPDGAIYGTAARGGAYGFGSLFRIDTGGALSQLFSFPNIYDVAYENAAIDLGGQLVLEPTGTIFGIARGGASGGEIYRLDNGICTTLHKSSFTDGYSPEGGLVIGPDGLLQGANASGGDNFCGNIFSLDRASGVYTSHASFDCSGTDSEQIGAVRFGPDGKLYGNTLFGGANDQGTLFTYDPATNALVTLANLDSGEFSYASGNVAFGAHGRIFGTTNGGGRYVFGSVYSYTPGKGLRTEVSFNRDDRFGAIS